MMTEPLAKKPKVRAFQPSWTDEYGFVCVKDRAVCTLCCEPPALSILMPYRHRGASCHFAFAKIATKTLFSVMHCEEGFGPFSLLTIHNTSRAAVAHTARASEARCGRA